MSLSAFKEKILAQANEDAKHIAQKHAALSKEVRNSAAQEIRTIEESIIVSATKEAQRLAKGIHQRAEFDGRSTVLMAKQEELFATKDAIVALLTDMPEKKKKELQTTLRGLLPKQKGVVKEHEDGGLVFQGEGIEINLSLNHLIEQIFTKYRSEIARELFT